jgi:hypothetical protein
VPNVEDPEFEVRSEERYLSPVSLINFEFSKLNCVGTVNAFSKGIFTHCVIGNGHHTETHEVCEIHLFNWIGTPEAEFFDLIGTKLFLLAMHSHLY